MKWEAELVGELVKGLRWREERGMKAGVNGGHSEGDELPEEQQRSSLD